MHSFNNTEIDKVVKYPAIVRLTPFLFSCKPCFQGPYTGHCVNLYSIRSIFFIEINMTL